MVMMVVNISYIFIMPKISFLVLYFQVCFAQPLSAERTISSALTQYMCSQQ